MKFILCLLFSTVLVACSDSDNSQQTTSDEHVWQKQTEMLDKANQVEGMLNAAVLKQKQQIDAATADQ